MPNRLDIEKAITDGTVLPKGKMMAEKMVEVVIKIPETLKTNIDNGHFWESATIFEAIQRGTIIPKGHGDLKDYDAIKSDYIHKMSVFMSEEERMDLLCTIVDEAPAIIEADRGDKNG